MAAQSALGIKRGDNLTPYRMQKAYPGKYGGVRFQRTLNSMSRRLIFNF